MPPPPPPSSLRDSHIMHGNHHCVAWLGHGKHPWPLQVENPLHAHDVRRGPPVGAPSSWAHFLVADRLAQTLSEWDFLPCRLSRPRLPPGGPPGRAIRRRTARRVQPEAGDRPFAPLGRRGEPRGPRSLAPGSGPTGPRARPGLYRHFRRRNLRLHRSLDPPGTHRTPPDGRRRPLRAL